jgi:hypothetical protein
MFEVPLEKQKSQRWQGDTHDETRDLKWDNID